MTTERKHRCGGALSPRQVQVQYESEGMLVMYVVPGLVCSSCQEELVERDTVLTFEKSQVPTVAWLPPATSYLNGPVFEQPTASTALAA